MILILELNSQENWGTFLGFQPTWQKELEDSAGGSSDFCQKGKEPGGLHGPQGRILIKEK